MCRDPAGILGRASYVFVVSHMRSRSSLLSHILGSHPDVAGYFEQHLPYRDWRDLLNLRLRVHAESGTSVVGKQLLDQVLHNHHEIFPAVLRRRDVRCLFLLRPPAATIDSLLRLSAATGWRQYGEPEAATAYYVDRLAHLEAYVRLRPSSGFLVDSDALVAAPERVLDGLSRWLELSPALSARYEIFPRTGQRQTGDSSPHIRAGRVVDTSRPAEFELAPALLRRAETAYDACRAAMAELQGPAT